MIRRYELADVDILLEHIGVHLSKAPEYKGINYDRNKMRDLLVSGHSKKSFFCDIAVIDGKIVGGLCAGIFEYVFSREVYASDYLFYLEESKRSLRTATELVKNYVEWGKQRRVREVCLTSTTGIKTEKYGKFCERMGFRYIGSTYTMEI